MRVLDSDERLGGPGVRETLQYTGFAGSPKHDTLPRSPPGSDRSD
jgi:hypothetical protein